MSVWVRGSYCSSSSPTSFRSASRRRKTPPRIVTTPQKARRLSASQKLQARNVTLAHQADRHWPASRVITPHKTVDQKGDVSMASTVLRTRGSLWRQKPDKWNEQNDWRRGSLEPSCSVRKRRCRELNRPRGTPRRGSLCVWARHPPAGPLEDANCSTLFMARSKATQAMTLEYVNCFVVRRALPKYLGQAWLQIVSICLSELLLKAF